MGPLATDGRGTSTAVRARQNITRFPHVFPTPTNLNDQEDVVTMSGVIELLCLRHGRIGFAAYTSIVVWTVSFLGEALYGSRT